MGNLAENDLTDDFAALDWDDEEEDWESSSAHCGDCGAYAVMERINDDGSIDYRCEACGWETTVQPEERS